MKDDEKLPDYTAGPSIRRLYWQEIDPVFGEPNGFVTGVECDLADFRSVLEALEPEQRDKLGVFLDEPNGWIRRDALEHWRSRFEQADIGLAQSEARCAQLIADREQAESDLARVREELRLETEAHRLTADRCLKFRQSSDAAQKRIAELERERDELHRRAEELSRRNALGDMELQEALDELSERRTAETEIMNELGVGRKGGLTLGVVRDMRARLERMEAVVEAARNYASVLGRTGPFQAGLSNLWDALSALDSASAPQAEPSRIVCDHGTPANRDCPRCVTPFDEPQAAEPEPPQAHSECVSAALCATADALERSDWDSAVPIWLRERAAELRRKDGE